MESFLLFLTRKRRTLSDLAVSRRACFSTPGNSTHLCDGKNKRGRLGEENDKMKLECLRAKIHNPEG